MDPFGLKPSKPDPFAFDEATRRKLCELCGVTYKAYDPAQDAGKSVVRPNLRHGMVVCGPCGNKVINFSHYCEVRGDGSYGPSGGGWEVVVCTCPEHGQTVMRATWKDLVAHEGELIVAFTEHGGFLPAPATEIEDGPNRLEDTPTAKPDAGGPPLTIDV